MDEKVSRILGAAKNLGGQAQGAVEQGTGALRELADKAGNMAQLGADALRSLTDEVNELLPAIRKAGYTVQGVDLDVAIPPKVSVHCTLQTDLSAEDRAALLESLQGRLLIEGAVAALFRVADAQRRLSLGSLRPSDVILELGVTPGVKVRYRAPAGGSGA